jgi:hypothetical protein
MRPASPWHALALQLLAELSLALSDDFRVHVPELLPRFVGLFMDAERTAKFDMVRPALTALEVGYSPGLRLGAGLCARKRLVAQAP